MSLMNGSNASRKAREAAGSPCMAPHRKGKSLTRPLGVGETATARPSRASMEDAKPSGAWASTRTVHSQACSTLGKAWPKSVKRRSGCLSATGLGAVGVEGAGCDVQLDDVGEEVAAGDEAALLRGRGCP